MDAIGREDSGAIAYVFGKLGLRKTINLL